MSARIMLMVAILALALALPASAQYPWCLDMDYITASVEDGVITFTHLYAVYNCCPDYFEYTITQEGNQITIMESEVLSIPCTCVCCYDLEVQVGPMAPGVYEIDFCWYDYESGIRHEYLVVEVPARPTTAWQQRIRCEKREVDSSTPLHVPIGSRD